MLFFRDPTLLIAFVIAMILIYVIAKQYLKRGFVNHLQEIIKPFQNTLFLNLFVLIGLLLLRGFLSTNPLDLVEFSWLDKIIVIGILIVLYVIISILLDILEAAYAQSKISLKRPLRPVIQALKILLIFIILFGIIAVILDKNPLVVMGSVSTLIAFVSFIFKDILLGLFAGIQLTTTETVQIGDYISVPNLSINGTVESIGLTSVNILNTNQTKTTVSAYSLIQNPITNYRHLADSKGRQFIKRLNFQMKNEVNLNQLEKDLRNLFNNDSNINQTKRISIHFEEGPMNNLTLSISLFTLHINYVDFDLFSTDLTLQILNIMAKHDCFS